jgi:antibiotic biosynthesis monooxygenase (ABM) superfamily enzyme
MSERAANDTVTGIIVHELRPDAREEYERWLDEIRDACRQFPGYLSTDVIRPVNGHNSYTVVIRFKGVEQLKAWIESDVRRDFLQRIEHALEKGDRYVIKTGLDFWFAQPTPVQPPKRYKQCLLTLSAIFPLTIVVPWLLGPLLGGGGVIAFLGGKFVVAAAIVGLMVYVIMPRYTRLVANWLYR